VVVEIKSQEASYTDIGAILFENKQSVNAHFDDIFQVAFGSNIDSKSKNYVSNKTDQYGNEDKKISETDETKIEDKEDIENDEIDNEAENVSGEDSGSAEEESALEDAVSTVEEMLLEELAMDVNVPVGVAVQQDTQVEIVAVQEDDVSQKSSKGNIKELFQDNSNKSGLVANGVKNGGKDGNQNQDVALTGNLNEEDEVKQKGDAALKNIPNEELKIAALKTVQKNVDTHEGNNDVKVKGAVNNQNNINLNALDKKNQILDDNQQSSSNDNQHGKAKTNIDLAELSKQNARVEAEVDKTFTEAIKVVAPVENKSVSDMIIKSEQPIHSTVTSATTIDVDSKATGVADIQNKPSMQSVENVERIVKGAKMSMARGNAKVEIRLDPPSLGPLTITMKSSRAGIEVQMVTNTTQAKQMLDQSKEMLHTALEAQGIQSVKVDVQVSVDINDEHSAEQTDQNSGNQADKDKEESFEDNLSQFLNEDSIENDSLLEDALLEEEGDDQFAEQRDDWQALEFGSVDFTV